VGLSELNGVKSLLLQGLAHLMKAAAWPESRAASHWLAEAVTFLGQAGDRFAPSMRQRISLDDIHRRALKSVRLLRVEDAPPAAPLPDTCPFSLDDLLDPEIDVLVAASRLREAGRD
jgi:hypothetical protein